MLSTPVAGNLIWGFNGRLCCRTRLLPTDRGEEAAVDACGVGMGAAQGATGAGGGAWKNMPSMSDVCVLYCNTHIYIYVYIISLEHI